MKAIYLIKKSVPEKADVFGVAYLELSFWPEDSHSQI